jgi:hypothetical protein
MVLMLKVVVIGPIGASRAQYDLKRRETQEPAQPGLPQ